MLGHVRPNPIAQASYCNVSEEASFQIVLGAVRADIEEGKVAPHRCMDELTVRLFEHARETRKNDLRRCLNDPEWGRMILGLLES